MRMSGRGVIASGNSGAVPAAALALWCLVCAGNARADEEFQKDVGPFLARHCLDCHGPTKQTSGIRYDGLTGFRPADRDLWTMAYVKVAAGEMPPKGRARPAEADTRKLLSWIERRQRAHAGDGTRRLNRREVAAALRDLTGVEIDYAHALPGDGTVAGFDTGADGLQDAADGVAQWMRVARRAVDGIRFLEPAAGKVYSFDLRAAKDKDTRKFFDVWKNEGVQVRGQGQLRPGAGLLLEPRSVGERDTLNILVPVPPARQGVLRLSLTVSAMKPMKGLPSPRLWVDAGGKDIDFHEITAGADRPHRLVYEVQLDDLAIQNKGLSIHLSNKVELPYAIAGFENEDRSGPKDPPPGGTGLYRPLYDRRALPPEKQPAPFIVVHRIDIEPQYVAAWPPAAWKADVGAPRDDAACAERLLTLWIERAWRRPATAAEREPFEVFYRRLRGQGLSFDNALRAAFQSVLLSAPFRYLASPAPPDPTIAAYTVASRLSFLLIGGPPDDELRRLAAAGRITEPAVLDAQVDRLLSDPRSRGFLRPFIMQWLEMEQPITIAQDHIQKQDFRFARHLKWSMREETLAYVTQLLADNRPAREIIDSNWTMMNDALSLHYGYGRLEGGHLRKVTLRADDPRGGGILGHAGIQSMLCWMGENWVIYRGAWALRHILDHPPPPPPLEVPELNPSDGKNKGKPFRELLRIHQEDARCSVCHRTIDAAGFAFQNFDISGRWRDVEHESYARGELDGRIAWRGAGKTRPVDAVGKLPRGEEFRGWADFKRLVVSNYQSDMVRGLMKNLVVYSAGRKPDVDDLKIVAAIMKEHEGRGYPLRDLLKATVRSPAFLGRARTAANSG
jgi:mono/diheme cytochrome c family protein